MAVDTTQQQPYDPVEALTRYLNYRNKPTAREQREKLTLKVHNALRSKLNAAGPLE
jgi:hypothetical protein